MTPADEVMRAMDDAVRAGKFRYIGLSDTPAWVAGRAQTITRGWPFGPLSAAAPVTGTEFEPSRFDSSRPSG
ncbi:aldo/keto reductase [Trinickia mobilis]|uniref:aldo/keto reductase n=1 Tax=Trinickia mobilis TaxID=2816356 RepID=UPI001A8CCD60|nr:aldo/keto reductase [Trinickia mobilis]